MKKPNIKSALLKAQQVFRKNHNLLPEKVKWFGNKEPVGFTSIYSSWRYFEKLPHQPNTNRVLATMCDMRIPLTFSLEDCRLILEIIEETAQTILI